MRFPKIFLGFGLMISVIATPLMAQTLLRGPGSAALDPMFQKVLQAPNDIELNLAFARKAIELEDFEAGVATLERLLIGRTDLPLIRLELGMLYLRLDAPRLAEAYFLQVLEDKAVDQEARSRTEILLASARSASNRNSFGMNVSLGLKHQSNAVARPVKEDLIEDREEQQLSALPESAYDGLLPNSDTSTNGSLTVFFGRELDGLTDRRFDASLTHYASMQNDSENLKSLDISMTSARFGLTLPVERAGRMPVTYAPYISANMLNTDTIDGFSTTGAIGLRVSGYLSQRTPTSYNFELADKVHAEEDNDGAFTEAEGKDGARYKLGMSIGRIHQNGGYTSLGLNFNRADTDDEKDRTTGGTLSLSYARSLLNTRFSAGLGWSETIYDAVNPDFLFEEERHDKDLSVNLGASWSLFGVNIALGGTYIDRDSNFPGKKYNDFAGTLTFSRSFQ